MTSEVEFEDLLIHYYKYRSPEKAVKNGDRVTGGNRGRPPISGWLLLPALAACGDVLACQPAASVPLGSPSLSPNDLFGSLSSRCRL